MTLVASGAISLGGSTASRSVNLELLRSATNSINMQETEVRRLANKRTVSSAISMSDFYGKGLPYFIDASGGTASASASSLTWSHTTTAATDCLIVTGFSGDNGSVVTISGITYNGIALTQVRRNPGNAQGSGGMWVLLNPPIGTYNIVLTAGSLASRGIDGQSANFGNVTAINTSAITAVTTTNPVTTTVTSTLIGLPIGFTHTNLATGLTTSYTFNSPTGMTLRASQSYTSNSFRKYSVLSSSDTYINPAGSTTMSATSAQTTAYNQQVYAILE